MNEAEPAVRGRNRVIGGLFTGWRILPLTDLYGVWNAPLTVDSFQVRN